MWEVVWTDPDKESRREHRERKAIQKEQRDKTRTARNSGSTRTSASSESKSLGIFGSRSLKRTTAPKSKSPAASLLSNLNHESKARRISHISTTASASIDNPQSPEAFTKPVQSASGNYPPDHFIDSLQDSPGSSNRDSVFSKWTENSVIAPSSPCNTSMADSTGKSSTQFTQSLGPSSFITKNTEIIIVPRTGDNDIRGPISETKISASLAKENLSTSVQSPEALSPCLPPVDAPINLFPGQRSQCENAPGRASSWATAFKPNNPDAWQPPEAWDCIAPPDKGASTFEDIIEEPGEARDDVSSSTDLDDMQRDIKRMAAASCRIRLIRLKESWGCSDDANLYKELEMERKHWMLSSLDNMDKPVDLVPAKHTPLKFTAKKARKVLALYESQATTSYLAALYSSKNIYHISPNPLSHRSFPNIHPVLVPMISSSAFPVAQGLFGAAYSLNLPSLLPSPEIVGLLKSVHRCLTVGGILHLTLIDPLPSAVTLGPRLRAWLDEHLLFNLERNFRCMNPSKLFPIWLADASLRAEGSTITTVKYFAVSPLSAEGTDAGGDAAHFDDKLVKQELRSLVGRMLWMEVWGQFIEADSWWWEDQRILQECNHMRTTWEYSIIEAVKDG